MPIRERILATGITGSGKSYQWLKIAEILLPTGAKFRCLDTDNDILYMLETQFPHLMPENGGNVYVHSTVDWPEYKAGIAWVKTQDVKDIDWLVIDKINNAWSTVQGHFIGEVFGEDMGDYFLEVRKSIQARGGKGAGGKAASSVFQEGLSGWMDWPVINRLYNAWIKPIVYQIPCHVYAATDVDRIDRGEKDAEILTMFGDYGIKPAGQKGLGGQMHTVLLLVPGKDKWSISTLKDRAGRLYFNKTPLISLYKQYLVAKAGWPLV